MRIQNNFITRKLQSLSLVKQIIIATALGVIMALAAPETAKSSILLGDLFVGALKAVAPILVFALVASAIANQRSGSNVNLKFVIALYLIGTFSAAIVAVFFSFIFPTQLALNLTDAATSSAPQGLREVLANLTFKLVDNPVNALITGNFIGILAWGVGIGFALKHSSATTKAGIHDFSEAISCIVKIVIRFAPLGIFGLVANTIATTGFTVLGQFSQLLCVLLGSMMIIALVVNPLIVYLVTRANPYPLVFTCLRESGITAFFTRSSAANIPVNMELCRKLGLHEDVYSVSIPLGATINMAGAAITITVLTLAAAHTLDIKVNLVTAILLSILAAISACGASGVAGGSLLLIPLACGLFNIDNTIAMQVVAIGFIIGVIQDSAETALNSSTDVVFTAAASHMLQKNNAE